MKRFAPFVALLGVLCFFAVPLWAASNPAPKAKDGEVPSAGLELAKTATQITGVAISPLLGVSAIGCYDWWRASTPAEKAALPWFANPLVWVCGFLLVGASAAKDAFGAATPPGWKKPLDVLETVENKVSGLVATGAVIPVLVSAASKVMAARGTPTAGLDLHLGNLAMVHLGAMDFSWLLTLLMVPLAIAVHVVVWIASHAINVLILLSPWGAVDAALKGARTALLGTLTALAFIDPVVGATLSVVIVVLAYFLSGWAFRLTTFGTVFCWDFFTARRRRFQLLADGNKVFLGRKLDGVPLRTYGRLHQAADGALTFKFRPWLVLKQREIAVPREGIVVGRGVFYSEVLGHNTATDKIETLLLLPPRYLGHEELFARTYHISGTCEVGLRKAWSWLKEALGFGRKSAVATA
ncbi:MAG: hypothetical protein HYV96_06820 [Opitutae bacterium]|nr:hypothetical protein [Opitutae bacterium]